MGNEASAEKLRKNLYVRTDYTLRELMSALERAEELRERGGANITDELVQARDLLGSALDLIEPQKKT